MFNLLFANHFNLWHNDLWYVLPAIVAVSLVYAATRHEQMGPIFRHAARAVLWIAGFLVAISVVIYFLSSFT